MSLAPLNLRQGRRRHSRKVDWQRGTLSGKSPTTAVTRVRSLCGTTEFGSRLDIVHYLPHQRLQFLSDRDQHNVVDRSYGAGGIHDREFNAAVTMLLNDEIAEQHRAV